MTEHILSSYCGGLSMSACQCLQRTAQQLDLMADLNDADMFIDCLREDGVAVVVAQARPRGGISNYQGSALGDIARREDEPAVYQAFESGLPVKDLKAVTQEHRSVMQDVAPIRMDDGTCVGVLIAERDVTREIRREQKLRSLENREDEEKLQPVLSENELMLREMNHRMKNQLQMLSSLMRVRGRGVRFEETRGALLTTAAEVDAIAAVYDAMTIGGSEQIAVKPLLQKTAGMLLALQPDDSISLEVTGDACSLPGEQAITMAIVAGELMVNAVKHGFHGRRCGTVTASLTNGNAVDTLQVEDNGVGFPPGEPKKTGGIRLVTGLVREKLGGEIRWYSDASGTRVTVMIPKER